jgi:hypothetical protein
MKWTIINKAETKRPKTVSKYGKYKPELRLEAKEKCVYCAIHENALGGADSFHVEHYKPKSKFVDLEKEFENLFYACAICNRFKGNDWPREPIHNHSLPSYPDPKLVDYNKLFHVDADGVIHGNFIASKYMIEKVVLNRPQLINERKELIIRSKIDSSIDEIVSLVDLLMQKQRNEATAELLHESLKEIASVTKWLNKEKAISKYKPSEIKRPK